ncbi:basement membrane-specific heparan sulfate proteoglycan core protein-like isoform X2 [Micropterus salmoides]|uniref:basement membrane-specific heparan sulfate proteoglycan core protein-like isoform X2 n=2 Tax=Micropterus salmoides TaxID=27706 RepID=UPI0018EAC280|nr:basement membrane-specific heparan sulfate proteoglycan core protein-like isoform X2 [Micropterus salmoides]
MLLHKEGSGRTAMRGRVGLDKSHTVEIAVERRVKGNKKNRILYCGGRDCLSHQSRMFVLIWATLFFTVWNDNPVLSQQPTLTTPPMTGGQETKLTCTAPGLCSESDLKITWMWRGRGEHNSHITGNITANQGKNSTLTFISSAEHHATEVTCRVSCTNDMAEQNVTLNVTYVKKPEITGNATLKEGDTLTLTCSVESFSPSRIINKTLLNETIKEKNYNVKAPLIIHNVTAEHSGQYICTAEYLGNSLAEHINVTVTYVKKPKITGNSALKEGDTLNLTCSVESFSPSRITWTKLGSNETLLNETIKEKNYNEKAPLIIHNVTAEHSGQYICTAEYLGNSLAEHIIITVTYVKKPKITGNSALKEGDTLNLTCSVESFSPSRITWTKLGSNETLLNETIKEKNYNKKAPLIIHNVTAEHSGQYICTAEYLENSLAEHMNVTVTYVKKPKITGNSALKEGDTLNLTCSIESFSPSRIMWTKLGSNETLLNETIKEKNYNEKAPLIIHNVTAEHSGQYICTAEYLGNSLAEHINVTVMYVKKPEITGNSALKEGDTLNLTCSVESFSPSRITWTKLGSNENLLNETIKEKNYNEQAPLIIHNVTAEHSGQYICTAGYLGNSLAEHINVTVMYVKKPEITGNSAPKEGDTLNLTCDVDSVPPSVIMWSKLGLNNNLTGLVQQGAGMAILVIPNMTAEYSGQYLCTATHQTKILKEGVNISVILYPKILNSSRCINQSEGLTCMCISQGVPVPTIKWPLLENHTEYTHIITVSNHTVNSTVTLTVKDYSNTVVECVSHNRNGEVKENLIIKNIEQKEEGQPMKLIRFMTRLEIIIAFLIGVLISGVICCLTRKCHRQKKKTCGNVAETLLMVTSHKDSLTDAGHAVEDYQAIYQEAAEVEGGAVAAEKSDTDYSNINFSLIKRKIAAKAGTTRGTTETEYAEIKKEKTEARQDGEDKEEEDMIGEDKERKHCVPDEQEGEDVALYSSVKDIIKFEHSVV